MNSCVLKESIPGVLFVLEKENKISMHHNYNQNQPWDKDNSKKPIPDMKTKEKHITLDTGYSQYIN